MASGGQANNINKCVNVFVYIKKGLSLQRIPSLQGDMAFVMMASKLGAPYLTHSRCLRNLTSSISHLPHWPEWGCGDETHEKTKKRERKGRQHLPTLARHRAWRFYRFTRVFFEASVKQACSPQERNLRLCEISDLSRVAQSVVALFKPGRLVPSPLHSIFTLPRKSGKEEGEKEEMGKGE